MRWQGEQLIIHPMMLHVLQAAQNHVSHIRIGQLPNFLFAFILEMHVFQNALSYAKRESSQTSMQVGASLDRITEQLHN